MRVPFAALLIAPLLACALPAAAQGTAAPLRVGIETAYPPFSSLAPDGKPQGFDIDIAQALCERLQRPCQFVPSEFDGMIPALRARKFDAIVASMSITEERKKAVDFSNKYYQTPARFVVKADAAFEATPDGLKGRRIGVQRATIHERFVSATFKGSTITRYARQDEAFLDLAAGRVDAVLADAIAADSGFLKTPAGRGYAFRGQSYDDPKWFGTGAGIAVRKGDPLRAQINDALAAMRADGSWQRIAAKYFDFDVWGGDETPARK
ncbi:MAG: ABC transporter substrate-binding protein [Rubrivivax sp.]|nr:ABC transporter substrate-binding protein [Rubrivivax sp.]